MFKRTVLQNSWVDMILLVIVGFSFYYSFQGNDSVIWSDSEGYYMYLPAIFIHDGFEKIPIKTKDQFSRYPGTNKYFTKYTYGVALMQLPFFLGSNAIARNNEETITGYETIYSRGIRIAALFYALLGLLLLRRFLGRYFSNVIIAITLVGLYFGTNLFYYVTREPGMSHIYSFFLFCSFLFSTSKFYEKPNLANTLIVGLLAGLIVLIRPTNVLLLLFFVFYQVNSWKDFRLRLQFYWKKVTLLWLLPLIGFLVFLPQFMYWNYISGEFLLYSYEGEGFVNWASPKVLEVLFHIKNGWLLFSPLAALSIIGLFIGTWKNKYHSSIILLILLLAIYAFSSWWCWWFGGAFGHRTFVEFYALLAIPFAYLNTLVFNSKYFLISLCYSILIGILIYYSYGLTDNYIGPHYDWQLWNAAMEKLF